MLTADTNHLDYFRLLRESRHLDVSQLTQGVRVAVLSDGETRYLVALLRVLFARGGFAAEVYAAEIDTIEIEVLDESSGLYRFLPDAIVLFPTTNALRAKYHDAARETRAGFGAAAAQRLSSLWDAVRRRSNAVIVQATYVVPHEREYGSYGLRVPESLAANILELNAELARGVASRDDILVCDLEGIASFVGKRSFLDDKLWTMAKTFVALDHLPRVAQALVDVVLATRGRVVKCVVVDLDNTLWGGVVGDDGLEGIQIGHYGEGEIFRRFQQYLREVARRGVALAVCSKNEHDAAIRVFREHPEMVLREDDIAVFVATWDSKVEGLERIRKTLDIDLGAMVFLDDNPFERNLVRQYLPDVIVPELPDDPSEWLRTLSELNLFETTTYTSDDRERGKRYREEASRKVLATQFTNADDYLRSLEMRVVFDRFAPFHLPRITQLLLRSNQFNLTTRRESLAECESLMNDTASALPIYVTLADKLGDYGLISVAVVRFIEDRLEIDTWVMSCRVLSRGVEQYMLNRFVDAARERPGVTRIIGKYVPTAKNAMVRDLYARLGFEKIGEDGPGPEIWQLCVARYEAKVHYLTEITR